MFRSRSKEGQAATHQVSAAEPKETRDPEAPKGRPTPKRSEAQGPRRTLSTTPTSRKDAARRQKEARRADMARQREALASGDERYLPARDKGPVRRLARDFVDAKWSVAEFFLPMAIIILVLSMINAGAFQSYVMLLWLLLIVLIVIDSVVLSVRLKKKIRERYPDEPKRGAVAYALMRTLQMRRMRLPKPQVARGEKP
ncbi:DUF3043 domain-containing protein [Streptomyces iconiensis]|uniref:DUF3043 domain-containing protein n=1 Tax=Streptomyces iconiensis TaxID=1384038 RepID=A0ABT7A5Z1_9ACTN|nr:DUF3043 domain-containing protein [Streptomyces iconiensis]MDJ1136482.1 DUF3043 domain-containing protein [Streptomyces iconiensis]